MRKHLWLVLCLVIVPAWLLLYPRTIRASCVAQPIHGVWTNVNSEHSFVPKVIVRIPCNDNIAIPSHGDAPESTPVTIQLFARCPQGVCDYGKDVAEDKLVSPHSGEVVHLRAKHRWRNADGTIFAYLQSDGRLMVVLQVYPKDGQKDATYTELFSKNKP